MSGWPGGSSQPQQVRLVQALHDFGDATDQAVRAWAGRLTMRQGLDITYVLTDILRLLETAAERLSRYHAGSKPAQDHDAGSDQPNEEIAHAGASIGSARAALLHPFHEVYRASGGWRELGGDPARDGAAVFMAHLLCQRLGIVDEPWPELSGTGQYRDHLVEALIGATDGLAWGIQNLARDAPEPMRTGLTEAVVHLDDTFGHLRESLICSAKRDIAASDAEELDRRLRLAIPLPERAQALRTKNARSSPLPADIAAADFPCSAAESAAMRFPAMTLTADLAAAPRQQSRRPGSKEYHGHHQ
jgi:hypothetical protein